MKKMILSVILLFAFSTSVYAKDVLSVYCGITMVKPVTEIAKQMESCHDVQIRIIKGGTGDLLEMLLKSKKGDLFLPGSDSYITRLMEDHPTVVVDQVFVGINKAAIFVRKGNPKNIPATLDSFLDPSYTTILGSPKMGSVGRMTKSVLDKKGISDQVMTKAKTTSHSQGIVNALQQDKADLSINWFAVSTWPENINTIETLPIPLLYSVEKKLVLSQLSYSKHPKLAKAFLDLAESEQGAAIFKRYGFSK